MIPLYFWSQGSLDREFFSVPDLDSGPISLLRQPLNRVPSAPSFVGAGRPLFSGVIPAGSAIHLEALPAEEASVYRECTGAEHRDTRSQYRQQNMKP
jgi:hypothetical protein